MTEREPLFDVDDLLGSVGGDRELLDELTARARDDTLTVVSYNATTFHDRDRRLQGVFAAARDMTALKRFEHTLQQKNAELEDASRLESEFLANMSHELRTPLNAIIGFSEVLRDGLIGDLTDLSKVAAGKMTLDLEPVQMSSLLLNSLSVIREKAATRHIRPDMHVAEELGLIQADPRKVKQILFNLLSNAVKFTNEGGQVAVSAERVPRAEVGQLSGSWTGRSFPLGRGLSQQTRRSRRALHAGATPVAPQGLRRLSRQVQPDARRRGRLPHGGPRRERAPLPLDVRCSAVRPEAIHGRGARAAGAPDIGQHDARTEPAKRRPREHAWR